MARNPNQTMRVIGAGGAESDLPPQQEEGYEADDTRAEQMREKMEGIVQRLEKTAEEQVRKKRSIEQRILEDLRQYHGRYDQDTEQKLRQAGRSQIFVKTTRAKTNAWEARLTDMLFPTDDKNWGIKASPVPDLAEKAKQAPRDGGGQMEEKAGQIAEQANALMQEGRADEAQQMIAQSNEITSEAKEALEAQRKLDDAKRRADLMEREIDDQLVEARFNSKARDAIHDGCKIGTGVIKGPLTGSRPQRRWAMKTEGGEQEQPAGPQGMTADSARTLYVLQQSDDPRPDWRRVDPLNWFPDMNARNAEEREFDFERHLMGKKELRKLANLSGFDKDALREVLEQDPREGIPEVLTELRHLTNQQHDSLEPRYQVWEYHGPLESEDIETICECLGDTETLADIKDDPLIELRVIVWFCQGRLLKFGLHPLESGDSLYSVWNFEKDDTSEFGFGVPALMRDSQRAMNAAWRAMMDNANLSAGPQIVINKRAIQPADGNYQIRGHKIWHRTSDAPLEQRPFEVWPIESNQEYYANIIQLARQFSDEETQMPNLAEQGHSSKLADGVGGMAMLMNSVNVVFRRVVRNWDDDITTPCIRRAYDWNMQFNERNEIKGDFEVEARGSSVLLVRELQSQNLMVMAQNFLTHPVLGPMTKPLAMYRKLVQSMMIPADEVVLSDEEWEQEQKRQAENQQPPPEVQEKQIEQQMQREKLQSEQQIAQMKAQTELQSEAMQRDTELMKLAQQHNMTLDQLQAKIQIAREQAESKERQFASEVAVEERKDRQAMARGFDINNNAGGSV